MIIWRASKPTARARAACCRRKDGHAARQCVERPRPRDHQTIYTAREIEAMQRLLRYFSASCRPWRKLLRHGSHDLARDQARAWRRSERHSWHWLGALSNAQRQQRLVVDGGGSARSGSVARAWRAPSAADRSRRGDARHASRIQRPRAAPARRPPCRLGRTMNDYANFYRQIAEMERCHARAAAQSRSIGPGPAWERTPEANGGRGQPLLQQAPEWSSALRSARVSQSVAPKQQISRLIRWRWRGFAAKRLEQRYSPPSEDWGWRSPPDWRWRRAIPSWILWQAR